MKKFLTILILGLLWCGTANAELKQSGPGEYNSTSCILSALDAYKKAQEYLTKNPKKNVVVYMSCSENYWQWSWKGGKKLESIHKKSFEECTKYSKKAGTGECFLFSTNDKINWKLNDYTKKLVNEALTKTKEHDEERYTGGGQWPVRSSEIVKYAEQDNLIYKNPKDNIEGRYLYDQEDVTDDYQVHAIYILASDSKDKKYDVKGTIEKIVIKGNKHFKKKTKEKQFRLDLTKEGKLDVSFIRANKTKKQINKLDNAAGYFTGVALRNGFSHPKKLYTIFYQDKYKREWGQVGDAMFYGTKGDVEVATGVTYLGGGKPIDAWVPHLHELIHALGFVQLCAPGAIIEKNSRWGKNDHLDYKNDIMSDRGGDNYNIDKKRKEYYGHSISDCEMDLRKSAFLEPTEKDFQLQPRSKSCKLTRWLPEYNHDHSLECLSRLDF